MNALRKFIVAAAGVALSMKTKPLSRQRLWQIEQKEKGCCIICGKRAVNASHCQEHRIATNIMSRLTQRDRSGCKPWKPGGRGRPPLEGLAQDPAAAAEAHRTAQRAYSDSNIAYAEAHHAMTNAQEAAMEAKRHRDDAWLKLKRAARLAGVTEFSNARP